MSSKVAFYFELSEFLLKLNKNQIQFLSLRLKSISLKKSGFCDASNCSPVLTQLPRMGINERTFAKGLF
jgi:hypothetical protein